MLGATKIGWIQKLSGNNYLNYKQIKFRFEPVTTNLTGYKLSERNIIYKMFSSENIMLPGDRLYYAGSSYVIVGVGNYTDTLGGHIQCVMRGVGTSIHSTVTQKSLSDVQTGYDAILKEWDKTIGKTYTSKTIKVLLDIPEVNINSYIKISDAGKLEDIDWIMTVDYPDRIEIDDIIEFGGISYVVRWRIDQVFQISIGLEKSKKNYENG